MRGNKPRTHTHTHHGPPLTRNNKPHVSVAIARVILLGRGLENPSKSGISYNIMTVKLTFFPFVKREFWRISSNGIFPSI